LTQRLHDHETSSNVVPLHAKPIDGAPPTLDVTKLTDEALGEILRGEHHFDFSSCDPKDGFPTKTEAELAREQHAARRELDRRLHERAERERARLRDRAVLQGRPLPSDPVFVSSEPVVVAPGVLASASVTSAETFDLWFERYFDWKKRLPGKNGSIRQDKSKYKKWVSPRLGALPIDAPKEILADACEEVRDDLNDAVHAYIAEGKGNPKDTSRASGKLAGAVWGVLVTGLNYAKTAPKRSGLRVRGDNPCDNIQPPDKSPSKYRSVLRPAEWLAVARREAEELRAWRETHAVMLYGGLRPGEGMVLQWPDVDFTIDRIKVTKAWDYDELCVKPTKTWETRDVAIEPTLRPLLVAMHKRARGRGPVLRALAGLSNETALSKILRSHLIEAGVTRGDLHIDPKDKKAAVTKIAFRFRGLRDTYITWRLWRGDNPFVVQRQAGHKKFATTEGYLGDVDKLSPECGVPFPELPSWLICGDGPDAPSGEGSDGIPGDQAEDSNPSLSAPLLFVPHRVRCRRTRGLEASLTREVRRPVWSVSELGRHPTGDCPRSWGLL
jgi:integrase